MEAQASAESQTRTQRRVLQTRMSIEDAFIRLVLERGYDAVSVEDVAAAADVAKATFYAHFANKDALRAAVFKRLNKELAQRIAFREGPWDEVRPTAMRTAYQHAAEMQDLYRVCLADPQSRAIYTAGVARNIEDNIRQRLAALGRTPKVPVAVMSTVFAGAHVAILEAWLSGGIEGTPEEVADMELNVLVRGLAWGHDMSPAELREPK